MTAFSWAAAIPERTDTGMYLQTGDHGSRIKHRSCSSTWYLDGRKYCIKSGTSMAAPVVSGAIALLLEKEPHLTNVEVKMRLKNCARNLNLPKYQQGWGMIDVNLLLT